MNLTGRICDTIAREGATFLDLCRVGIRDGWGVEFGDIDRALTKLRDAGAIRYWRGAWVSWDVDLSEELAYFFDEVRRLRDLHGEVRFVFGFDS